MHCSVRAFYFFRFALILRSRDGFSLPGLGRANSQDLQISERSCNKSYYISDFAGSQLASRMDPEENLVWADRRPFKILQSSLDWLEPLHDEARLHLKRCWDWGGGFFEVLLKGSAYFSFSVCIKKRCDARSLVSQILPIALTRWKLGGSGFEIAQMVELSDFAELNLDFVLVGVYYCGTTSLRKNLNLHPRITLFDHDFPGDFSPYDVLPNVSGIRGLNARALRGHRKGMHVGLATSYAGVYPHVALRLSRMPNVRVILLLCDPIGVFEKSIWYQHVCKGNCGEGRPKITVTESHIDIFSSISKTIENRYAMGQHAALLQKLFGDRLKVVHQSALAEEPRQFFDELASFIGVPSFPKTHHFKRWNSYSGRRTNLCDDPSRVKQFVDLFEQEYIAMESVLTQAGQPIPETLRLRRNRCQDMYAMNELGPRCMFSACA